MENNPSAAQSARPSQQLFPRHEIKDPAAIDSARKSGCEAKGDESELRGAVRIRAERYAAAGLRRKPDEVEAHVLAVGIRIDFNGLVQLGRAGVRGFESAD
jgi:hypothetical protein